MFGIGLTELIVILVLAALVLGPEEMVKFAGQLGRWVAKFRRETRDVTREFRDAFNLEIQPLTEIKQELVSDMSEVAAARDDLTDINWKGEMEGTARQPSSAVLPGAVRPAAQPTSAAETAAAPAAAVALTATNPAQEAPVEEQPGLATAEPVVDTSPEADAVTLGLAEYVPEDAQAEPTVLDGPLWVEDDDQEVVSVSVAASESGSDVPEAAPAHSPEAEEVA
ncbi:MAG: twin-arginine translocase TatA/TatE family subunit [Anaerolineae bacterium]|jgi:Sec-independent protein translocase protein TatA|nr:hypothetical protein [Anaerolineales bacterium]